MTQNAYFSLLKHTKQLLLVTFCDTTAGIGASFWTNERTYATMDGQTWRLKLVFKLCVGNQSIINLIFFRKIGRQKGTLPKQLGCLSNSMQ